MYIEENTIMVYMQIGQFYNYYKQKYQSNSNVNV